MLRDLTGLSFEETASLAALGIIRERLKPLSTEDQDDLAELLREFVTAGDDEARDRAAYAIAEILGQSGGSVTRMNLDAGQSEKSVGNIGVRIRELRKAAGLTQEQLAAKSGLTQSHLCRLENGDHSPSGVTLERIANGLGLPLSRFSADTA